MGLLMIKDVKMQACSCCRSQLSCRVLHVSGYGNTCPRTKWGKVATIVYAIVGMPLFLLYLSNIGDILARSFKWTFARCCLCRSQFSSKIGDIFQVATFCFIKQK